MRSENFTPCYPRRKGKRKRYRRRGRAVSDNGKAYALTLYVEPTRSTADIVINSGMNSTAFELVKNTIQKILDSEE